MSVLETHVFKDVNQCSPTFEDVQRVVKFGNDNEELVTFEPVDYKSFTASLGSVEMWSFDALVKAGINPQFNISTGLNSRIEGVGIVNDLDSNIESIISSDVDTIKESVE